MQDVKVNEIFVKIDMFKVIDRTEYGCSIITTEKNNFSYDDGVIKKRSKSATAFDQEQTFTKTELIELFACISINDVWSAQYQTFNKTAEWEKELAVTIQGLTVDQAAEYIKKNFGSFGKTSRTIVGHKINQSSGNNYYMVRDLAIHFDLLQEGKSIQEAEKRSIRNIDVNSLQYLIFNGVKYILKKK